MTRADETAMFLAAIDDTAAFLAAAAASSSCSDQPSAPDDSGLSEAVSPVASAGEADPASTLPVAPQPAAQDTDEFRRVAHLLATGAGPVHRITRSNEGFDLSGLDAFSGAPVSSTVVGDSFVVADDWQALALAELAADERLAPSVTAAHAHLSTEEYMALVSTQRRAAVEVDPDPAHHTYVAPVVGPMALGHTDAMRRHAMLQESTAPAAVALRSRDEAFKNQRTYTFEAQRLAHGTPSFGVPPLTGPLEPICPVVPLAAPTAPLDSQPVPEPEPMVPPTPVIPPVPLIQPQAQQHQTSSLGSTLFHRAGSSRGDDDVPVIARGAACFETAEFAPTPGPMLRATSVSDRVPIETQSLSVPDPAAFAPVPVPPLTPAITERGVAAAVAAVQNVYADYAPVAAEPYAIPDPAISVPNAPAISVPSIEPESEVVASSVAAAYAAAVYQNVSVPESYLPPTFTAQIPPVSGRAMLVAGSIPAVEIEGDFSDPFAADAGYSAAYIDYMVQDEFEHRHDTPAQRNAALGRMRIVNGAANAPVPLSETLRNRHPA